MLPYQPNSDWPPAPPPCPLAPGEVPLPLPGWAVVVFVEGFSSLPESLFANAALAIFFLSASASACSSCSSVSAGVGFIFGDGLGEAFAKIVFFGEGFGLGVGLGVGFGVGFGVAFGVALIAGVGFGVVVDVALGFGV